MSLDLLVDDGALFLDDEDLFARPQHEFRLRARLAGKIVAVAGLDGVAEEDRGPVEPRFKKGENLVCGVRHDA